MNPSQKRRVGKYELGRTIGVGAFGKMRIARNSETGETVNVKILDREALVKHKCAEKVIMEIATLKLIKHPNVLQLYEVIGSKTEIYVVVEYVGRVVELFDKIVEHGRMHEYEARKYFQQLISAVDYCHSRGVYHRDLKPENVLLDDSGKLKVSDFGLSALSQQVRDDGLLHTSCGSPNYAAPEVLDNKGYDGATADLWSCGVILFVLLAGYCPFDDTNFRNLFKKISAAEFTCPPWISFSAINLITRILDPNPKTRITIPELLNHKWFKIDFNQPDFMEKEEANLEDLEAAFQDLEEKLGVVLLPHKEALQVLDRKQGYSFEDILSATNNFSDENLITEGAVGKVYKGQLLQYGNLVNFAVRRLDFKYGQGDELETEIIMLKSLRHKNIVSSFWLCDENNEKIVIYRQSFHGTLDQHLNDPTFTWSRRLRICLGVAHALNYIHYDFIHCDISSSKIFLDNDWEPKLYGFELSTKYPQSWKHRLLFTHYFGTNNMTPKYDVYSFGLLLLEVLCGRKPMITNEAIHENVNKIIDPNLRKQMDTQSLAHFTYIAYKCLNKQLVQRPSMDWIVKELEEVLELQWKHTNLENLETSNEGTSSNSLKALMEFLKIPLSEIKLATNDFDEAYSVGCGGYGIVYKAKLDVIDIQSLSLVDLKCKDDLPKISKTVAIKRIFSRADEQGKQGFLTEIELLTSCKHPNIVSLLGFSREAREMILVYEYAFKGSLSDYFGSNDKMVNLTWAQRLQICLDIAHGINYLHTNVEGKPRIIHRDIKSENILLDENLKAKVADFGLSKFHPLKQQSSTIYTKNIAGTQVYMDPEYLTTFKYKRESDIYSFGVVLFEVLSGSMAYDPIYIGENDMGLAPVARRRFNEGTLKELIDPKIIEEDDDHIFTLNRGPNQDSFDRFSKIAYQCLAETQAKRPTMEVVIKELQNALNLQGDTMVLSRFRLSDIVAATEDFAEAYCIGLDTNGMVYKAELEHFDNNTSLATEEKNSGEPFKKRIAVAMKRITCRKGVKRKQGFFSELEMHATYKHPNIVPLLGFCDEGDEMILLYEHGSKRSLHDYLKNIDNMNYLTWTHRLHLCLEIAYGLNHLHTKMENLHGDVKSANILLDKNWEVKIAYFGISKLHPTNQEVNMKVYIDPEYEKTGKVKTEMDVFSFGVVLFEILCWRLAYDPVYIVVNGKGLAPIARQCINDGTIERIIDPKLKEETNEDIFGGPNQDSLDIFLNIAYQCLGKATERPTMQIVIKELEIALHFHEILQKKLKMSLKYIETTTKNFDEKNCVGSGRFWKAYKGELPFPHEDANGDASGRTKIVAKRWDSNCSQGYHQFRTEFNTLFKCKHENIIGLVGFCNEGDEKIIVYEHMSNGSLDKYLKDAHLTWIKRLKISVDVARGLEFLHQGDLVMKKVVHRDIRSSNIILNDVWKAKISNMELSSLVSIHQDMEHVIYSAYDTFGYLDPLYKRGFLTEESDIYSLGVVLFEILCGRLAWEEGCKDHSESLGCLAKRCYEEGKLDDMVFEGIKEQIGSESLATFADIAYRCLLDKSEERPMAREVVIQLKKALNVQEDYEIWEAELPKDYKEIIEMSEMPEIYPTAKIKDLDDTPSKDIIIQEGKVWPLSLASNGERNEMVSASQFSYENHQSHKWVSVPESRFDKIAEMLDISNLNIQIKIKSQSLSPGVNYGVHLVFKFHGARKFGAKPIYVNLTYKMRNETLHAYFATWREDEWMTIELYRFLNHNEVDATEFDFLLESFSRSYCGKRNIYLEGVELLAIDNASFSGVKHEENNITDVQQVNMDPMPQLPTINIPFDICGVFTQNLLKLFSWRNKEKQHYMLSANEAFCDSFNVNHFTLRPSTEFKVQKVVEVLSTQVFRLKHKIESQVLLQNTEYMCYLVFKLSEKCCGLHCPVIVRDLQQCKKKQKEVVYFRPPSLWNIHDVNRVPQEREDGWMEVNVWKFRSNYEQLQNDCIFMNLKFVSYEGTMSGLIVRGLEFRPMEIM